MIYAEIQGYINTKRFKHEPSPNGAGVINTVFERGGYVTIANLHLKNMKPTIGESVKVDKEEYAKVVDIHWVDGGVIKILVDYVAAEETDDETWASKQKALDDRADWMEELEKREEGGE